VGQLGDGSGVDQLLPIQIPSMHPVLHISAGGGHAIAQKADGSTWTWGFNFYGQLGLGDNLSRFTPFPVPSLSGAVEIKAGGFVSLALMPGGQLLGCGANFIGQLGTADYEDRNLPTQVVGYCIAPDAVKDTVLANYFRPLTGLGDNWIAGELKSSIRMPEGDVMWLFGKSSLVAPTGPNLIPCDDSVFNAIVVQDNDTLSQVTTYLSATGDRSYFQTATPNTTFFTPGHGYIKGDTAIVFLAEYAADSFVGTSVGRIGIGIMDLQDIGRPVFVQKIRFGNAVIVDSSAGYVYIYGVADSTRYLPGFDTLYGQWPYLARCPYQSIYAPWEYWAGGSWSSDSFAATPISNHPISSNYSAFKRDSVYYLVSEELNMGDEACGSQKNLLIYRSNLITGLYGDPRIFYTAQDSFSQEHLRTFDAYAHPWLSTCDSLLVTYNRNDFADTLLPNVCPGQCLRTGSRNADTWRPQFIRVPYASMGIGPSGGVVASFTVTITGSVVQFHNQSQGATVYLWDFGDGNTSTAVHPAHTYASSGVIPVTLWAIGCGDTVSYTLLITDVIKYHEVPAQVGIYPNPNTGNFTIHLANVPRGMVRVDIVNMMGLAVYQDEFRSNAGTVDKEIQLNDPGVYLLNIHIGNMALHRKIVVLEGR
jgi:hypothetical protein